MSTKQNEAQRLADDLAGFADEAELHYYTGNVREAAVLLLRQDELLKQAFRALDYIVGASAPMTSQQQQCWPAVQEALAAIRAHLEAK